MRDSWIWTLTPLTDGGPPALPVAADAPLRKGQRAFHPGFPQGAPGEVTTRLLGRETLKVFGRGAHEEAVLAWAEVGRTDGLVGPVLDLLVTHHAFLVMRQ